MKRIAILGSTGSVGRNTLEVATHLQDSVQVVALAAKSNIDLLEKQAHLFHPEIIAVYDLDAARVLQKRLPSIPILAGMEGLEAVASFPNADFVVSAIVGSIGIIPTVRAIEAGKSIGLANKEVLISAGEFIMDLARKKGGSILPIDSEHSAIFQCLEGASKESIHRIILTASGGPFRNFTLEELENASLESALIHPNWNMGKKITIDSSTLMNKGLEVIEAHHLFATPLSQIEVVIHPQSLIHSFVEFIDGSMLAQMSEPDMKLPIHYAINYPIRKKGKTAYFDFKKHSHLDFFPPDFAKFPCLRLAYSAASIGGTMPCFMNAANEVLVEEFIEGKIRWIDIPRKLEKLMNTHSVCKKMDLETILGVDKEARIRILETIYSA